MLAWAIIQHAAWEGPGLIASALDARGWKYNLHRMDEGAAVPAPGSLAGLVVMGGPMGVYDAARHPYLQREKQLLAETVEAGIPVLGVCLGAQLLASALGARVAPGPTPEIGEGTVELTPEGQLDPVLGDPDRKDESRQDALPVVHWHQDTYALPEGATLLASSPMYPQQAFRAGRAAYGLQFHCELTPALAAAWRPRLPPGTILSETHLAAVAQEGRRLYARFLDLAQRDLART